MSKPLTREDLREELRDQLNDRFEHYEKRQDARHTEMMHGFADVIDNVNTHITEELAKLRRDLDVRQEFDHLASFVAQRFGVSVHDLTGR